VEESGRQPDPVPGPARDGGEVPGDPTSEEAGSEVRYLPAPASAASAEAPSARALERRTPAPLPAAIVAATGGFLAGVASFVLVRVLRRRRSQRALGRALGRRRLRRDRVEIAGSRSFLVDIHLLRR
jgi:hypothetical protein